MENKFTIQEVRNFWDQVAKNYDQINTKIGPAHYQRFTESLRYLDPQPNNKILNIWSRTGNAIGYIKKIEKNIDLYNLEVSPAMIQIAKLKFPDSNFQITDLDKLNFDNNFFDKIISLETLEHAPRPKNLIKEFYRILKPGGLLVMSLPPKTAELPLKIFETFFDNHGEGPHRFMPSREVKKILNDVGFKIILHKGTLLIPAGPLFLQKIGEKFIEAVQSTPIKELGIRQFYVCQKPK